MILILILLCTVKSCSGPNEFPPTINANSSIAVVIDKTFFGHKDDHRNALEVLPDAIDQIVKKEMRTATITVHYFHDIDINLNREYMILLSVASCYRTWHLHESTRKEALIHLAVTDSDCPRFPESEGLTIPMIITGQELAQIFLDLRSAKALTWNMVTVLHDDTFERDMIGRLMKAVSDKLPNMESNLVSRSLFTLKHGDSERTRKHYIKDALKNFHVNQLGRCFLVIGTENMIADVMEIARSLKITDPVSQWLYVMTYTANENATNITSFAEQLGEGENVAFLYNATDINHACDTNLLCYIKGLTRAVSEAIEYSVMNEIELFKRVSGDEFNLIRLTKAERRREVLHNIKINFFANLTEFENKCGSCVRWRFSSGITWGNVYLNQKNPGYLIDTGTWMSHYGVNLTDVLFPHVAHGFRGIKLPIVTYHNPPWQIIETTEFGQRDYDGLVFDTIKYLARKLNFTYSAMVPTIRNGFGSTINNRSTKNLAHVQAMFVASTRNIPEQVINLVQMRKAFIGACASTVNDIGKSQINFTIPIFVQTYSFITSRPRQLSRALLFASPFTKETWACLAASIIIMGPILYLVHKYSPVSTQTSGLNSSWQCVWYVYGALLQQGGMYLPHSDSARLLVGIWWLAVMVLVATYSGSLVAFLTFPKMDALILTVDDLLSRRDGLTWGFYNDSSLKEYLRNANEEKYKILLERAERHNGTDSGKLIQRIKDGKHVLIDWRSSLRFLMRQDLLLTGGCHFSLSSDEFLAEPIALIVSHESPYLPMINGELHRMHESGLMNKWVSERMPLKDKCWEIQGNSQVVNKRKVNVADMQGIFFVLFIGVTLAIIVLCCEFYWHRRKVSKERKLIRPFVS